MIKIDQNYTDYRDDTDPKYPGGKAVNATTTESTDGTPLRAEWMNDVNGALQALFIEAFGDINQVSGKPDNAQESDVLKAIKKITQEYTDKTNAVEVKTRAQDDASTLNAAKDYTDQRVQSEAQTREQGDASMLNAVKNYTDQRVQAEAQTRGQGDASTLNAVKNYTDGLLIKIFQNGYIQWPWMPSPDKFFSFKGYRWAEVNYDGCFFRAKGTGAEPFGGKEQGDAIRNITGYFGGVEMFFSVDTKYFDNKLFTVKSASTPGCIGSYEGNGTVTVKFDTSGVVPTARENRPRNKTFIIWQLKKI